MQKNLGVETGNEAMVTIISAIIIKVVRVVGNKGTSGYV